MNTIKHAKENQKFSSKARKVCIFLIWAAVLYSLIIQYKVIVISNAMLILGALIILTFFVSHSNEAIDIKKILTKEIIWMLVYMIYQLIVGFFTSPQQSLHIGQWITSMEYMLIMIIISSLIIYTGSESFHMMLLVVATIMAVIFLINPVSYPQTPDRFSISKAVNPNALGMSLTAGVWAVLYFQQKGKIPTAVALGSVMVFVYGVFRTGSRKALIAAGIIILLWYFFSYISNIIHRDNPNKYLILCLSILLISAVAFILVRLYIGSDMQARMEDLGRETTTGARSSLYQFGWMLLKRSPVFGFGFQGFKYFNGYYSHATIVEVPVSGGIIGTFLYFLSYIISLKKCFCIYRIYRMKKMPTNELKEIKMILYLWMVMLFYCTCIIHPYQFESCILFGIIFGQSTYLEGKIRTEKVPDMISKPLIVKKSKYIR